MILSMAPALVALHGFTHTGASWDPVIAALGERYRALAPDIRGHGAQSDREPLTLEAVITDIAALAPARFVLAGYSMGGRIALHVALALPERVERLVLVGASPGIADPLERSQRREADERLADQLQGLEIEELARRWARTPVLAGLSPELAAQVHQDRLRNRPAALANALRALGAGALPSLWPRLGELAMPVLLGAGARDPKFSRIAERMALQIPGGEPAIIAGAGHAAHLEAPERLAALIADTG